VRPFVTISLEKVLPALIRRINAFFQGLTGNFALPSSTFRAISAIRQADSLPLSSWLTTTWLERGGFVASAEPTSGGARTGWPARQIWEIVYLARINILLNGCPVAGLFMTR